MLRSLTLAAAVLLAACGSKADDALDSPGGGSGGSGGADAAADAAGDGAAEVDGAGDASDAGADVDDGGPICPTPCTGPGAACVQIVPGDRAGECKACVDHMDGPTPRCAQLVSHPRQVQCPTGYEPAACVPEPNPNDVRMFCCPP